MSSFTRPIDWNAFTWIGVFLWSALSLCANVTWPIDRTATLRKFSDLRDETEKRYPDFANSLPKNIPIRISSGYPLTYIQRDENSNATFFEYRTLVINCLICIASTVSVAFVSQRYLQRYSVRFLIIAMTTTALFLVVGQFGERLVQNVGFSTMNYYDNLFRILFVSPGFVVLCLSALLLWRTRTKAEPNPARAY